jgi:hypothetical protein
MLPRAAEVLRQRIRAGNLGLRDPRSIPQGRNALYAMFGGKVQLRPAHVENGEKPYLIARVGLDPTVLLEAAGVVSNVVAGAGFGLRAPLNLLTFLCDDLPEAASPLSRSLSTSPTKGLLTGR